MRARRSGSSCLRPKGAAPIAVGTPTSRRLALALTFALAFFAAGVAPLDSAAQRESSSPKTDRALNDPIDHLHRTLNRLMPAACTAIFVYDATEDRLEARWVAGHHRAAIQGLTIPVGQRLTGWVAANRATIVNSDAALDLGNLALKLVPAPQACLSTAICANADLVGALTVYSTTAESFSEAHGTIVESVASRLASSVQRWSPL